ncbi:hypothetical protein A2757_00110 [Candidatus Giovannonibacteria bacterium RIFCSPHIGHO2_01_FULL_48_47]|uniref:DUF4446 domain-containing protein n=1 Tax=Candidatus Niyogibacteria bacterium RIFCSPLOWO2_02_FULL_45_13 TaxID=1801725 RepID=A0A1G2EXE8_9BACT|nr:MAG: hypothetical protein A2757_00110 [Candidatus Giovannonibacteria bacterium RIFCSPHIGHO2_01_FULL_48_47]OGF68569.1 MAG: hypothetical protein A3D61_03870 [Candidatus Giovannonibacteria bacterium RIFCSPHIGHO2_02_FULL_48_15]OGF90034.1 MAG: hypothetical protein A3B26_00225 [Candidatus Giovannonibacteria bacterium RIFCSPLOWO2_01_FULL_48_47]OGF94695.1 MAG: hypothetical protein A2433_03510 [Candidatus Giovannonibacteria bacterium RIFOXYC1_FULL_48_8]OGF96245.1 MAG: hypothetical protein A2613_01580
MNQQILIYIIGALALAVSGWLIYLEIRLRRVFGGKKAGDLEDILRAVAKELQELHNSREEIEKYLETVERRLRRSVQYVGVVRFNPFQDAGGDQSFSIALMDEKKNGIVVSSLYGRENSRIYAKPLENASSKYQLAKEELLAIEEALKK